MVDTFCHVDAHATACPLLLQMLIHLLQQLPQR